MKTFYLVFLLLTSGVCDDDDDDDVKYISKRNSVDGCIDWSVDLKEYHVLAGEPVRVKCALFYSYIRTNYSTAANTKLRLIWYKNKGDAEYHNLVKQRFAMNHGEEETVEADIISKEKVRQHTLLYCNTGAHLIMCSSFLVQYDPVIEVEPIIFSGHRLSKEDDSLWFRSAELEDNGFYTCVLRNSTYCMKVSMSVTVEASDQGKCFSSRMRYMEKAEITRSKMITCPDIEDYLAPYKQPQMTWYKECEQIEWRKSIIANSTHVWIPEVEEGDGGNYTCELQYGSRLVRRTLELKVTALQTTQPPKVLFPPEKQDTVTEVIAGMPLSLDCKAFFGYSGDNKQPIVYWMKGEKFVEELAGHIKESEVRILQEHLGEREVQLSLIFDAVEEVDLANYTCYVENHIGRRSGSVFLRKRYMYRLELAGGLGVILLLLGVLTAIYKCYNLEILLCYRSHFGSDETEDDNKEYDAYLYYTKVDFNSLCRMNNSEETLALEILPDVLEKHYGYKLFIPDRDLIPSSTYVDDLARSVDQSRRLILVLTPDFVAKRGWSIFLIETRLHTMLVTGEIKVIMIECLNLKNVINYQEVELLKQTIKVLSVIKWKGPTSNKLTSKFWKQMVYEMPAKQIEMPSRDQVALTTEIPDYNQLVPVGDSHASAAAQMRHFCHSYDFQLQPQSSILLPLLPSSSDVHFSTLGPGRCHNYCNIPMTLLNGEVSQSSTRGKKLERHLSSTQLSNRELRSDIW